MIHVHCDNPACRKQLRVKDELIGKRIKCPACGGSFQCALQAPHAPQAQPAPAPAASAAPQGYAHPPRPRVAVWHWLLPGWIVIPALPLIAIFSPHPHPAYIGVASCISFILLLQLSSVSRKIRGGGHPVLSALVSRHIRFLVAVCVIMFTSVALAGFILILATSGFTVSPAWAFLIFVGSGFALGLMFGALIAALAPWGKTYRRMWCPTCGNSDGAVLQRCRGCDVISCSHCNNEPQCVACRRGSVRAVTRLGK